MNSNVNKYSENYKILIKTILWLIKWKFSAELEGRGEAANKLP